MDGATGGKRPLTRRALRALVVIMAAGVAVRVAVAFASYGVRYDMDSLSIVAGGLRSQPLHVYDALSVYEPLRWPYPPGFFGFAVLCDRLSSVTGLAYHGLVQLPSIAADAALAWVVQDVLARRGRSEAQRLFAAGLVALGPSFIMISGYHGQIDPVAILPAAVGVALWDRDVPHRARWTGVLIGAGAAIKTVPIFLVLAALPTARSWRERLEVAGWALAVPAAITAPFLLTEPGATLDALTRNKGVPGFGGLSLLVQPALAGVWLYGDEGSLSDLNTALSDVQNLVVGLPVLLVGAVLFVRRTPVLSGAAVIWLTVYVFNPNFAFQYLVWGLPFFLMAGHLRAVAAAQAVLIVPALILYRHWGPHELEWVYVAVMDLALVGAAVALLLALRRLPRPPPAAAAR